MIIHSLYQYAKEQGFLSLERRAFKKARIHWVIDLNDDGQVLGIIDTSEGWHQCPQTLRYKGVGGVADFLVDSTTALFGIDINDKSSSLSEKQAAKRHANNRAKYDDFWRQISEGYEQTRSPLLESCLKFKNDFACAPEFLRWGKKRSDEPTTPPLITSKKSKPCWWIQLIDGQEKKLTGAESFSFAVHQELVILDEIHVKPFWLSQFSLEAKEEISEAPTGLCSITGHQKLPLALTHIPKIKRVPDTQSFGANLVSADKDSFLSYGFKQSLNASASVEASTGYCTALNQLLKPKSDHNITLNKAVALFWTRNTQNNISSSIKNIFEYAQPGDVSEFFKRAKLGERGHVDTDRFYTLILAGNAGRIMVRHWIDVPLDQAKENFKLWFDDLELENIYVPSSIKKTPTKKTPTKEKKKTSYFPLSFYRLACATVREPKDIRTELVNQLFLSAFEGTAPSLLLLQPLLSRLRITMAQDGKTALYNHSLFALIKLIIVRHHRSSSHNKDTTMSDLTAKLNESSQDPGYLCGRLLAVLSRAQKKAHNYRSISTGVAERYFGTAMASPQSVFPLLLKLNRHHLNKLDRSSSDGKADDYIERDIEQIVVHLTDFPRTLDLKSQGRFALGFYQEQASESAKIREYLAKKERDQKAS